MKKILFIIFLLNSLYSSTQTLVTIGNGTGHTPYYPFDIVYYNSRWEGIYLNSEINQSGKITALKFDFSYTGGKAIDNIKVYIKKTNSESLSSGSFSLTGYTLVFTGTIPFEYQSGWKTITLDTPFEYCGSENLEIAIERSSTIWTADMPEFHYSTVSPKKSRYAYSDAQLPSTLTATSGRPNIQLIFQKPTLNAGQNLTICQGDSKQLNANGGDNYSWSPSIGLNATNIKNPIASPIVNTTYTVTSTSLGGCVTSSSILVSVNPVVILNTSGNTNVCHGSSTQLNVSGGNTYFWQPSSGLNATNISNPIASPNTTTTYNVTATNLFGCSSSTLLTVNVNPTVLSSVTGDTILCFGDSTQLTASGGETFSWYESNGFNFSNIFNPIVKPLNSTTYFVNVTNSFGCSSIKSIKVLVNPLPILNLMPINPTVSAGDSIILSVNGALTYTWSPSNDLNKSFGDNVTCVPSESRSYTITGVDNNGCFNQIQNHIKYDPYLTDELWFSYINDNLSISNGTYTNDNLLNIVLAQFEALSVEKVFPYSNNIELKKVYKVKFTGNKNDFKNIFSQNKNITKIEEVIKPQETLLYDPSDYMWTDYRDWLWHLEKIQADKAWDISRGDPNIKIGVIDTWFDLEHPDLKNKFLINYDPFENSIFNRNYPKENHGTAVASFIAAETDGGGQLASIGSKCSLIGYKGHQGTFIEKAHHASFVMKVDILTSSAGLWSCTESVNDWEKLAVKEILDNGTIIVFPAGNGISSVNNQNHCFYNNESHSFKPFSPEYDERIIIVSSTGIDDKHQFFKNGKDITHSHYPEVDICSPGYNIMGAISTQKSDGTTETFPYYGGCTGTSFSTPIVAGVLGLMKSVNPCLTPSQAQLILKSTTDPILDELNYSGLVGTGRINAFKALEKTLILSNLNLNNVISQDTEFKAPSISCSNKIINNSKIKLESRVNIVLNSNFEIENGCDVFISVDPSLQIICE